MAWPSVSVTDGTLGHVAPWALSCLEIQWFRMIQHDSAWFRGNHVTACLNLTRLWWDGECSLTSTSGLQFYAHLVSFFPTSLCGVLVFGSALPPASASASPPHTSATHAHTQLAHTHNLLTHNLSTHKSLTTQLVTTQLVHTQLTHTQLAHTQLAHHTTCHHTTCPHTT